MRSLLIASCLSALLGAPVGLALDTAGTNAAADPSHGTKVAEGGSAAKLTEAKSAETKPGDVKAADAKGTDAKASESKAADTKAAETKAGDAKATDAKTVESKGTETTPASTPKPEEGRGSTIVEIKTSEGLIKLELADKEAPVTVKNFVTYVNDKFYDGTIFHRVIDGFMIQGGGYALEADKLVEKPTKAPIVNEAKNGLKNMRGTIAMARTSDPNSATAQFYINQVNNNNLDYPSFDGHGYAVFGKVIDGIDVVDKIAKVKTGVKGGMPDVPLAEVKILSVQVVRAAGH